MYLLQKNYYKVLIKDYKTAESSLGSGGAMQQPSGLGTLAGSNQPSPGGLAFNPMQTPPGMFPAGPPNFDTAFGGAFKGLDMSGFKPVITPQQDMVNFSINGNEVQGMNSAYTNSVRDYLNSTGQGDAFSGYSGLTPLGGTSLNQTGQAQQLQLNQTPPEQMVEEGNSYFTSMSPEERVRLAQGRMQQRDIKTPEELAFLNRIIKSEGMDYLREIGDFTGRPLTQLLKEV
jgi:hypothetical protein